MKLDNGKYDSFRVMVQGGAHVSEVHDALVEVFGDKATVVVNDTISEINYNYVMERLQDMEILSQMNKGQRDRAYEVVKREYYIPDYVDDTIKEIINNNWTTIVFGDPDAS